MAAVAPQSRPLLAGMASVVGVSGNVGTTVRQETVQSLDYGCTQSTETLQGFAGGVDISGALHGEQCQHGASMYEEIYICLAYNYYANTGRCVFAS